MGALSLLGGLPDQGKSLLTLELAARATKGEVWPCNEGKALQGDVILMTVEDSIETAVYPRLKAAGADLSKVHVIKMAKNTIDKKKRMFNLATDLAALEKKIDEVGNVVLVII